jgi:hypothetical protein
MRGDYEYQKVQEVDASAQQIYDQSLSWMAQSFESSNHAIQLRDEDNRRIVANAVVDLKTAPATFVDMEMDLIVEAKDGRFRMTGRNYETVASGQYEMERSIGEKEIDDVEAEMDSLRTNLKSYIQSDQDDDDW